MNKGLFLIGALVRFFISCGDEDVDCKEESIQTILIAASNTLYATIGHQNVPCCLNLKPMERMPESEEECWAFDKAYEVYINTLRDFKDCAISSVRTISDAQRMREALNCN